jgi:orotate phosphoribosyltransferase
VLRQYGFEPGITVLSLFSSDAGIKAHPKYKTTFEGQVVAGGQYVLVDDVTSLGGTLAELNNYIVCNGGEVVDVVVLVNAGRNPQLIPNAQDVRIIKERFQDECIEIFGIQPDALTANEARYLVGFRSVDEIRNCVAKARQEIDRRLRAKGIPRPGVPEASLQADAKQGVNISPNNPQT